MVELLAKKDIRPKKPWPWPDNYTLKLEEFISGIIKKESVVAYTGGESHTFDGGLIMKMGETTRTGNSTTVTFGTAFPTACFQAIAIGGVNDNSAENTQVHTIAAASFVIQCHQANTTLFRWIAIGH